MTHTSEQIVTAAIVVIGDEVLSGRTKDLNVGHIAEQLTAIGIDLREVRIVADVEDEIVAAVNHLRARYDHVFTTGGIGPTHDDITADAIARAFGVAIDIDDRAVAMLREHISEANLNQARLRMARIPDGAELITNPVSKAPGFTIGNVHVMAGVPAIMQAMLAELLPSLTTGSRMMSRSLAARAKEGDIAGPLGALQKDYPEVSMGSYPSFEEGVGFTTTIVLRSRDKALLDTAQKAAEAMLESVRGALAG
jgi:molybdenum cofactor synthesis domain-containing protein